MHNMWGHAIGYEMVAKRDSDPSLFSEACSEMINSGVVSLCLRILASFQSLQSPVDGNPGAVIMAVCCLQLICHAPGLAMRILQPSANRAGVSYTPMQVHQMLMHCIEVGHQVPDCVGINLRIKAVNVLALLFGRTEEDEDGVEAVAAGDTPVTVPATLIRESVHKLSQILRSA